MHCGLCGKAIEGAASFSESGVPRCGDCLSPEPAEQRTLTEPSPVDAEPKPIFPTPAPRADGSGYASAALALGAVGLSTSFFVVGGLLGLVGMALGIVSLSIRKSSRAMAWTGVGLSTTAVAVGCLFGYTFYQAMDADDIRAIKDVLSGAEAEQETDEAKGKTSEWLGVEAPELKIQTLDGNLFSLEELRGRRVIIDIWASWCAPCTREIPHFQQLHLETPRDELVILGLSFEDDSVVREFVGDREMDYAVASSSGASLPAPFNRPPAIPTTYFVDRNGVIDAVEVGYRDYETLLALASRDDYSESADADASAQQAEPEDDQDTCSHTELMHGAMRADKHGLRRLLADGQQLEEQDKAGMTALMHAAVQGRFANAAMLLDLGARIETRDKKQRTALIHAAANGRVRIVNLLLRRGANRLAKDAYGRTALDWSREKLHPDAAAALATLGSS